MDPVVAVGLWLLNVAVAPDAYTRIANAATSRSHSRRLEKAVRRDTTIRPGLVYRRWLRDERTWANLVARRQDAYERLVDSLAVAEARGILRSRPEDRTRAVKLVDATIAFFLPSLDPSTAAAVGDFRAERRHEELVKRLDASSAFEERLDMLPPAAAPFLRDEVVHRGLAERVVDGVLRGEPPTVIATWSNERPDWLVDAPGIILLAVAQLAQAYGLRSEAGRLFEETADLGLDPPRWYARASFEAQATGEPDRRDQLMRKAHAAGGGKFVDFLDAALKDDWPSALSSLGGGEAAEDPFTGPVYAFGLGQSGESDAEINYLTRLADTNREYTNSPLRLAQLLLARTLRPGTTSRDLDLRRALELAVGARDRRRIWRGDSGAAVELACQAAIMAGNYRRAIVLGTVEPEGEAWPEEAARPEVRFSVAQAAMASGDHALVERVATITGGFHRALLKAEILAKGDSSPDELAAQYNAAWALAADEEDKVVFWLSASANGIEPLPGAEELEQRSDDVPALCLASQHLAAERFDEAIEMLRPRRMPEAVRRLLTNAYLQKGDIDAAVTELFEMAQRFSNVDHRVRAIEILVGAGRLPEAAEHADRTLPLVLVGRPERNFLHEVGVAAAHNRHAWPDMETRVRAWITESGSDRRRRWLLVLAIYNQANPEQAWRILQEGGDNCPPESEIEGQLWIALHARFRAAPATLSAILALVERFPDAPDVRAVAVNAFFLMGDDKGEISEAELARWHALIKDRADKPAPHDTFIAITVPDDPEGFIEAFRPLLEGQAQLIDSWLRNVRREGWPYGMLSMVAGRPYTKTLVQRPTGYLPIAVGDPHVTAAEVDDALAAIDGGRVVVDNSALVIASYVPERWPQLLAAFGVVEVTPTSRRDAAIAADDFQARSNETLSWDVQSGGPVLHTTDDATLDRLHAQLTWVNEEVAALPVRLNSSEAEAKAAEDFGPWMATFRAAQEDEVPLWADDVGLRTLARSEGVAAFGTCGLLQALADLGRLTDDDVASTFEALRSQFCVDLPIDPAWVVQAARDRGGPGPALLVMSRPSMWIQPQAAFDLWSTIAETAADEGHTNVPAWVYAAATGITAAARENTGGVELTAGVLVRAATLVRFDPQAFASCAAAAAAGVAEFGHADPTESALAMTMDLLQQQHGVTKAATIVARLGSELADEHREALRRILFGI